MADVKDLKACCELYTECQYFPNMDVAPGDYIIDEDGFKRRKEPKIFKCLYTGKPVEWNKICPMQRDRMERAEKAEEEVEDGTDN